MKMKLNLLDIYTNMLLSQQKKNIYIYAQQRTIINNVLIGISERAISHPVDFTQADQFINYSYLGIYSYRTRG